MKTLHQNIKLPACKNGSIANAKKVFSYIDSDFEAWGLNKVSAKADATEFAVLEMEKDGTFKDIFGSISSNLDSMCLTQAQIVEFCKKHKDKLRTEWYGNFFLFKVGDEFFVAGVSVGVDGGLSVDADRFSDDYVWYADVGHRIVVPQLTLGTSEQTLSPSDTLTNAIKTVKEAGYLIYKAI